MKTPTSPFLPGKKIKLIRTPLSELEQKFYSPKRSPLLPQDRSPQPRSASALAIPELGPPDSEWGHCALAVHLLALIRARG